MEASVKGTLRWTKQKMPYKMLYMITGRKPEPHMHNYINNTKGYRIKSEEQKKGRKSTTKK